jgi:hypothetical protein
MKKKVLEEYAVALESDEKIVLDGLLQSMYSAATQLQGLQGKEHSSLFNAALMGMSADVSQMLTRFRKITSALKTGDDKRIEKTMSESRLRELISSLIAEEIRRR